jgi:hypothetical protein
LGHTTGNLTAATDPDAELVREKLGAQVLAKPTDNRFAKKSVPHVANAQGTDRARCFGNEDGTTGSPPIPPQLTIEHAVEKGGEDDVPMGCGCGITVDDCPQKSKCPTAESMSRAFAKTPDRRLDGRRRERDISGFRGRRVPNVNRRQRINVPRRWMQPRDGLKCSLWRDDGLEDSVDGRRGRVLLAKAMERLKTLIQLTCHVGSPAHASFTDGCIDLRTKTFAGPRQTRGRITELISRVASRLPIQPASTEVKRR